MLLALYDFKGRYYGNYLGVFWALLNPILTICVYYFVFGLVMGMRSPDFIFYMFSGLLFWNIFTELSTRGLTILTSKKYLIENIGIKKVDLFISATLSMLLGFVFKLIAFILISLFLGRYFHYDQLYILVLLVLNFTLFALAVSLINALIGSVFKDFHHLWALVSVMGIWINPIIVPIELYDQNLPNFRYYNPFAGMLINLRETFLYGRDFDSSLLLISMASGLAMLIIGILLFRSLHKNLIENYDTKQ